MQRKIPIIQSRPMEKSSVGVSKSAEWLGRKAAAGKVVVAPGGAWEAGILDRQRTDEIRLINAASRDADQRTVSTLGNVHRETRGEPCDAVDRPSSNEPL